MYTYNTNVFTIVYYVCNWSACRAREYIKVTHGYCVQRIYYILLYAINCSGLTETDPLTYRSKFSLFRAVRAPAIYLLYPRVYSNDMNSDETNYVVCQ